MNLKYFRMLLPLVSCLCVCILGVSCTLALYLSDAEVRMYMAVLDSSFSIIAFVVIVSALLEVLKAMYKPYVVPQAPPSVRQRTSQRHPSSTASASSN